MRNFWSGGLLAVVAFVTARAPNLDGDLGREQRRGARDGGPEA